MKEEGWPRERPTDEKHIETKMIKDNAEKSEEKSKMGMIQKVRKAVLQRPWSWKTYRSCGD